LLERHVPETHLLRAIDRFVELDGIRAHLAPFYRSIRAADPYVDRRLLLRHRLGTAAVRRGPFEPGISLVLPAGTRWLSVGPIERSMECFDLYRARLIGDSAYGSAEMMNWQVHNRRIEPYVPVFDKSIALTVASRQ